MGLLDVLGDVFGTNTKGSLKNLEQVYNNVPLPELEGLTPALERELGAEDYLTDLGPVDFEGAQYSDIDSMFDRLSADPIGRESQLESMNALQDIVNRGGMNLSDAANMNRLQTQAATGDQGRRNAILQNMASRGMGGSGMELLAQLQSNQAATDRMSQAGMDQAGMMQDRALQGILAKGDIGRQMTNDDWQRNAQKARAQDAISQFNARNSLQNAQNTAAGNYNAGIGNRNYSSGIQESNLGFDRGRESRNIDRRNRSNEYNVGRSQQQFDNQITKAGGTAQSRIAQAESDDRAKQRENQMKSAILGGGGEVTAAAVAASDEDTKKNIQTVTDDQLEEFFASIRPKSFSYKDPDEPGQSEGEKVGFIAQDVQDTSLADMILREQEGKPLKYDSQALQGVMLAAITKLMEERNG